MTLKQRTIRCVLLALFLPPGGFLLMADSPLTAAQPRPPEVPPLKMYPAVVVEAVYPGANAQVVLDSVAAPIEQQLNGLEKVRHLSSRCTNDGKYTLLVSFEPGIDLNFAQVFVQNRVTLAMAILPTAVQNAGVAIRKQSSGAFLFVTLYSPDASMDTLYLSNYASIYIRDELLRLPGMADVTLFGEKENALRIWLDPERLAALSLTPEDVNKALRELDSGKSLGRIGEFPVPRGQAFQLTIIPFGKLDMAETIAGAVLKTGARDGLVRLKDVARVELGSVVSKGDARFDGKSVLALGLSAFSQADERKLRAAVRKRMEELKKVFPPGIDYTLAFDLTANPDVKDRPATPSYLLAEPILPSGASTKRTQAILERYSAILMDTKGVQHVLALPANPFDRFPGSPCVIALLAPNTMEIERERLAWDVRRQLEKVEGAEVQFINEGRRVRPGMTVKPVQSETKPKD